MKRSAVPTAVLVVAAALVALLAYGVIIKGTNHTLDDAVRRGDFPKAPGLTRELPVLGAPGKSSLSAYKGKIVVLNFWAHWCVPCGAEAPILKQAQANLQADGAGTVLGAIYNDTPDLSQKFLRDHGLTYPNLRDVGTNLAHDFGTTQLPETFVIDRRGRIVAISRGQVNQRFMTSALARARAQS